MNKKLKIILIIILLFFAPQIYYKIKFHSKIIRNIHNIQNIKYGVVFGARVRENHSLTDVTKERILAAIQLYHAKKIETLFISGDNRNNQEADSIALFAEQHGVPRSHMIVDKLGIDTQDTCRHLTSIKNQKILLFTQNFHMARTLAMCEDQQLDVIGFPVNTLGLLPNRGSSLWDIYTIRLGRLLRESALSWLFMIGLYDDFSLEAEAIEAKGTNDGHRHEYFK